MGRILVIDDEAQARRMLRIFLERLGHAVVEAEDGDAGLKALEANPTDLIITDIVMPNKEGLETITDIRRASKDVKIIAISGGGRFGNTDYLEIAERFGADRTYNKPLDLDILEQAVTELIGEGAKT